MSMVVGSGLFGLAGITLDTVGLYTSAVGWVLISLAVLPLIYVFVRLGLRFTSSAGLSQYAQEVAGKWAGYAVTAVLAGTFTIGIPALAFIGAAYIQRLFGVPVGSTPWIAIAILAAMTLLNVMGVKVASVVNTISLIALFVLVSLLVLLNLPYLSLGWHVLTEALTGKVTISYIDLWKVSALLFWAFLGWENMSFGLEEFRNPRLSIPLVYWFSFIVVVLLYLALAFTCIGAAAGGLNVAGASGLSTLTKVNGLGLVFMGVIVLVILANANAWVFGASRLIYASGREGILPRYLGKLSKNDTPIASLLSLLVFYTAIILGSSLVYVPVSNFILLVSQNFLVLYLFSLFAFWKTESGWRRWLITPLAALSCVFLLSGFSWWIVYPILLMIVGYIGYSRNARATTALRTAETLKQGDDTDDNDTKVDTSLLE